MCNLEIFSITLRCNSLNLLQLPDKGKVSRLGDVSQSLTNAYKRRAFPSLPILWNLDSLFFETVNMASFMSDDPILVNKPSDSTTWSSSLLRSCSLGADNVFGPQVTTECRSFDFTLLFEESFFSIAPSVALLIAAPIRIFLLYSTTAKVAGGAFQNFKLVS